MVTTTVIWYAAYADGAGPVARWWLGRFWAVCNVAQLPKNVHRVDSHAVISMSDGMACLVGTLEAEDTGLATQVVDKLYARYAHIERAVGIYPLAVPCREANANDGYPSNGQAIQWCEWALDSSCTAVKINLQ